ncbi:CIC11C00000002474 [Sungouiella intermedia]|uniref:Elongation factor 1 alpha-like protein n=1 Tax=Sungouiella intermedia TaxID=45354 RepID=A0A1L0DL43_9ASCO|nr:CIC11C00000002474 [[Candida] intermedia]
MLANKRRAAGDALLSLTLISKPIGGASKLSSLAKSRGTGLAGLSGLKLPGSGLSGLSGLPKLSTQPKNSDVLGPSLSPSTPSTDKPLLVRKTNLGASLRQKAALKKAQLEQLRQPVVVETPCPPVVNPVSVAPSKRKIEEDSDTRGIHFALSVTKELLSVPENVMSVFLFDSPQQTLHLQQGKKRRQLAPQLFHAYTNSEPNIVKAKSNFSLPSPDDKVLEAQKQAFAKDLSKLTINEPVLADKEKKVPASSKPFKNVEVAKELAGNPNFTKPNKSFVIIGHVDAGKSTLMGRILYDSGTVDAKTVNKLVREAEKSGKGSFALAWIMDQTSEERSRGVTIDICATNFETPTTRFTAIDAPGHKDFVPQMISGVSQADMALLVVDSITGEFEAGFVMDGQTKEHTLLAKNLGIDNICVAINKMDKENWSEDRFEDIKTQLLQFLTSEDVGFLAENVYFVPISGLTGINVVKNDKSTPELAWYKGPTLVDRLESIQIPGLSIPTAELLENADFNLAINEVYDVTSSEFKVKGKISLGMIQPGQTIEVQPTEDYLRVQSLSLNDKQVDVAIRGQIVSATFKINQLKNNSTDDLAVGDIILNIDSKLHSARTLEATVNMFNMDKPMLVGTPFVLFRNNASVAARISKIIKIDGSKKKKKHLVSKQSADVEIEILGNRLLPVTKFSDNKALGRIVIRREGSTVGAGVVTGVVAPA